MMTVTLGCETVLYLGRY